MSVVQLIYASRPFGFDQAMLNGILSQSRRCNSRDGITGALICRADVYLQLLEGSAAALDATYAPAGPCAMIQPDLGCGHNLKLRTER